MDFVHPSGRSLKKKTLGPQSCFQVNFVSKLCSKANLNSNTDLDMSSDTGSDMTSDTDKLHFSTSDYDTDLEYVRLSLSRSVDMVLPVRSTH